MNAVLDVLKLRRVPLNYISPPICPAIISGSGSGVFVESNDGSQAPSGIMLQGQCDHFIVWRNILDLECISLYKALDPNDPNTEYVTVVECVPPRVVVVCSPGWWSVTVTDVDGVESAKTVPVFCRGTDLVQVPIPDGDNLVSFTLYKNPDSLVQAGTYYPILNSSMFGAFEICDDSGCYKLQAITDDGASDLSAAICRNSMIGCCPPQPCSPRWIWDYIECSCVPDTFTEVLGPNLGCCIGVPYASQFTASGAAGPCLWDFVSGALPPGLVFHTGTIAGNTTVLDGTPTLSGGSYTFTVRCTDYAGTALENTFTMESLGIAQYQVPEAGITGIPYSEQLTNSGGSPAFSYANGGGVFPPGLILSGAGLISGTPACPGTYDFGVKITDGTGHQCETPLEISVSDCPQGMTKPTIANWGQNYYGHGAFDRQCLGVWWLPSGYDFLSNYHQVINLFDPHTLTVSLATDPNGLIDTEAKNDLGSGFGNCYIDTKYNQCVVCGNQNWLSWYDLTSKVLLAVTRLTDQAHPNATDYDSIRGLLYMNQPAFASLRVRVVSCAPPIRPFVADYNGVTYHGGDLIYCPDNDTVYTANVDGPNLLHKWDPTTHAFTYNVIAGYGHALSVRYARNIGLIVVMASGGVNFPSGGLVFIDPKNSDAVVGTNSYGAGNTLRESVDYNDCSGYIYLTSSVAGSGLRRFDVNNAFAVSTVELNGNYGPQMFDPNTNRLYAVNLTNYDVETY